jgi:DNA-binding GntR family transcriptional regulator
MNNSPVTVKQIRHQVADQLRIAILEGRYKPGEWLRQERLAQELGVSQMPVREALKELAAEGLIEHVPYHGVRVIEFSVDDIADLYAQRAFLEGLAARAAAASITPEEIEELKRLRGELHKNQAPENVAAYRELNRQFHMTICSASRRDYLIRTLTQMWATFPTMLIGNFPTTATNPLPNRDAADEDEHDAIIAALEKHTGKDAERLVRLHVETAGKLLVETLRMK